MALLEVKGLNVFYGKIHALKDLSLSIEEGEIVSLIGANGAGKTTLLTSLMHQLPYTGSVSFQGKAIDQAGTRDIVKMGMTMVPEGRRVFVRTSVQDNLLLGAYSRKDKEGVKKDLDHIYEMFPRLLERKNQLAGTLSGGEQQMLAMGRALMSRPKLMMLDEPSLGLAPLVVQDIFSIIGEINRQGVTILLIEQNANMALKIADLAYVLETGNITLSGTGAELLADEKVKEAYLGKHKN